MKYVKLVLIAATAAIFIAACGQAGNNTPVANNAAPKTNQNAAAPAATINPAPVAEANLGKELYAMNCAICHKDTGKGGKVTVEGKSIDPDDITTAKMKEKSDDKFVGYINNGFPEDGMPAFKDKLKPDEVKAIVKHIRALQGSL